MNRVVIIHFAPIEQYPPICNLLSVLAASRMRIVVVTSHSQDKPFTGDEKYVKVIRAGRHKKGQMRLGRFLNYAAFYLVGLWELLKGKPDNVIYFETLSSLSPLIYYKWINARARLFVHYHEYMSLSQYQLGMKLERLLHQWELGSYCNMVWVSHTNHFRMKLFIKDIQPITLGESSLNILPNYPPRHWAVRRPVTEWGKPIRVVYIGALSLSTMYTKEFAEWIMLQKGNVTWDIYSRNNTEDVKRYINDLQTEFIKFKEGLEYEHLPSVLDQYDVGVILYNGHIPNFVWNAPNKLFEYWSRGLDVWFPDIMKGCWQYVNDSSIPKISALDFTHLDRVDLSELAARNGPVGEYTLFCEDALSSLVDKLENP